jgi:outer membrane immunogenic protein
MGGANVFVPTARSGIDWFGTLRARAGIAFDRFLVYATGGFAFGGGDDDCGAFAGGVICGDDDWRGGWAAGGGVEWAFTDNITFGIEGLFVSLDRGNNGNVVGAVVSPTGTTAIIIPGGRGNDDFEFGLARAKVNFKF